MISNIKGISLALRKRGPNENRAVTWIHNNSLCKKKIVQIFITRNYTIYLLERTLSECVTNCHGYT